MRGDQAATNAPESPPKDENHSAGASNVSPSNSTASSSVFTYPPLEKVCIEHVLLFANPTSGSKKTDDQLTHVLETLESSGYQVTTKRSQYQRHVYQLIEELDDINQYHAVLIMGGDGTVFEVVNGLLLATIQGKFRLIDIPPVCILPAGSGNTIAYTLGISTIDQAIQALRRATPRLIDVMQVTHPPSLDPKPVTPAVDTETAAAAASTGTHSEHVSPSLLADVLKLNRNAWNSRKVGHDQRDEAETEDNGNGVQPAVKSSNFERTETEDTDSETKNEGTADGSEREALPSLRLNLGRTTSFWKGFGIGELSKRIVFSLNMLGYGLSWAILTQANSLRWMGSAQYNTAAAMKILSKPLYRVTLDFALPSGKTPVGLEKKCNKNAPSLGPIDEEVPNEYDDDTQSAHASAAERDQRKPAMRQQETDTPDPSRRGPSGLEEPQPYQKNGSDTKQDTHCDDDNDSTQRTHGVLDKDNIEETNTSLQKQGDVSDLENLISWAQLPRDMDRLSVAQTKYIMIQVQNTVHVGEKMALCPYAKVDDGLFDVVLMKGAFTAANFALQFYQFVLTLATCECADTSRWQCLKMLDTAKKSTTGEHLNLPFVSHLQVRLLIKIRHLSCLL